MKDGHSYFPKIFLYNYTQNKEKADIDLDYFFRHVHMWDF